LDEDVGDDGWLGSALTVSEADAIIKHSPQNVKKFLICTTPNIPFVKVSKIKWIIKTLKQ